MLNTWPLCGINAMPRRYNAVNPHTHTQKKKKIKKYWYCTTHISPLLWVLYVISLWLVPRYNNTCSYCWIYATGNFHSATCGVVERPWPCYIVSQNANNNNKFACSIPLYRYLYVVLCLWTFTKEECVPVVNLKKCRTYAAPVCYCRYRNIAIFYILYILAAGGTAYNFVIYQASGIKYVCYNFGVYLKRKLTLTMSPCVSYIGSETKELF